MPFVALNGRSYSRQAEETVLDALLRGGVPVSHACRKGTCRACLMQRLDGTDAPGAQEGLRPVLRRTGHFLPCCYVPPGDVTVAFPRERSVVHRAVVLDKREVAPNTWRILLEPARLIRYHAGQFITLCRPDGLARSYSLASVPARGEPVEIHVRRVPAGQLSRWIADDLSVGDSVDLRGPYGASFYLPGDPTQPMLLVVTGTGLGPAWGILRDALACGHEGRICLYHGSRFATGLYLREELRALARAHASFEYVPCLSGVDVSDAVPGRASDVASRRHPDLSGWRVFLFGVPDMVHATRRRAYVAGARLEEILFDPFEPANPRHAPREPT